MNIYFLFGEDSYRLQEKLRVIKGNIKTGDFGESSIDASENWDINRFENELTAIGFFGGERLIIVKNLLASKEVDVEAVVKILDQILRQAQDDTGAVSVIIIEQKMPDKRGKLFKWLTKNARSEEFLKLSGGEWNRFASGMIASRQVELTPSARQFLITELEGDSWQLVNVIDQLELWQASKNDEVLRLGNTLAQEDSGILDADSIKLFVARRGYGNSFKMLDNIASGNTQSALKHLKDLWLEGEDPLRVLGGIVYGYRQIIIIKAALEANINQYEISKKYRIQPFVVSKNMGMAKKLDWQKLKNIYNHIGEIDDGVKSGKIEPMGGIETLVYNLIGLHSGKKLKLKC